MYAVYHIKQDGAEYWYPRWLIVLVLRAVSISYGADVSWVGTEMYSGKLELQRGLSIRKWPNLFPARSFTKKWKWMILERTGLIDAVTLQWLLHVVLKRLQGTNLKTLATFLIKKLPRDLVNEVLSQTPYCRVLHADLMTCCCGHTVRCVSPWTFWWNIRLFC